MRAGTDFLLSRYHIVCTKYMFPACTTIWSKEFLKFTALILFTQKNFFNFEGCPFILLFQDLVSRMYAFLCTTFQNYLDFDHTFRSLTSTSVSLNVKAALIASFYCPHQCVWLKDGGHYVLGIRLNKTVIIIP